MRARGKVALVTGGSRRIGAAISRALAKAGYEVVLTYRTSGVEGKALAARIGGSAVSLDLSRPSTFGRFADRLGRKFGRLDLLVHNAAVFPRTPAGEVRSAAWDAVFDVNLRGPFLLTRALLPLLRKGRGGAGVLFLGDANAFELWPGYLPYCLSKLALPPLAAGLRKTLPPGVRVGIVRPGLALPPDRFPAERWERLRAAKPARRGIRTPEGVGRAVLHFARGANYNRRTDPHQGGVQ
jgi:NAD(P)-dependent dehydrogenase (short-subunit alcohol dehydrogenase family)